MPRNNVRNTVIITVAAVALVAIGLVVWIRADQAAPKVSHWNVVLISIDTTRADHLGCYGNTTIRTPNIDRLAANGTLFENCVTPVPITLPAHASLLTGALPRALGVRVNGVAALPDECETLAERLKTAGYATAAQIGAVVMAGKFGLGQGFDTYQDSQILPPQAPRAAAAAPSERIAEDICQGAIDWLREGRSEPFFLFLHFYDPHQPYAPPPRFGVQYEDRYLGEIAYVDEQIGRIVETLEALELDKQTLIVLTSDHGEGRDQHGEWTHGIFLYDTTLHVPLILNAPGLIPSGQRAGAQVRLIDVAPTILDLLGQPPLAAAQGQSLRPLIASPQDTLDLPAVAESLFPAYAPDRYPYVSLHALREDGWKYIHAPTPELYHVAEDPAEERNLATSDPRRVEQMQSELTTLLAAVPERSPEKQAPLTLSPQERDELDALGYVSSSRSGADSDGGMLPQFTAADADPKDYSEEITLSQRAAALLQTGKLDEAAELLRQLIGMQEDGRAVAAWPHAELGRLLSARNQLEEAIPRLERALEIMPEDVGTRVDLAGTLVSADRIEEAVAACRKALETDPGFGRAYFILGVCEVRRDHPDVALQRFREALQRDPALGYAYYYTAAILANREQLPTALAAARQAVRLSPQNLDFQRQAGGLSLAAGDYRGAIAHFREIVRQQPRDVAALLSVAQALESLQESEGALQFYQQAARVSREMMTQAAENPDVPRPARPDAWLSLAYFELNRGRYAEAIAALRDGLELLPDDPDLVHSLAWILATCPVDELRNGEEAVRLAEHARDVTDGRMPAVLDTLAAALAEAGRYPEAVETSEQAIQAATEAGADADRLAELQSHRALFAENRPYRMVPPPPAQTQPALPAAAPGE